MLAPLPHILGLKEECRWFANAYRQPQELLPSPAGRIGVQYGIEAKWPTRSNRTFNFLGDIGSGLDLLPWYDKPGDGSGDPGHNRTESAA